MSKDESTDRPTYVTRGPWVGETGRPDQIDDVADQFERPLTSGAEAFWTQSTSTVWAPPSTRWPHASRGWRSRELSAHPGGSAVSR